MSREREREKQTERERERHTHTHTHTDRQRQTDRVDLEVTTGFKHQDLIKLHREHHTPQRQKQKQTDRQTDTQRQRHKRVCVTIAFKHQQLIICTGIMHLRETDGQTQRWR